MPSSSSQAAPVGISPGQAPSEHLARAKDQAPSLKAKDIAKHAAKQERKNKAKDKEAKDKERKSKEKATTKARSPPSQSSQGEQAPYGTLHTPTWQSCRDSEGQSPLDGQRSASFVSFNILAQAYVKKELFPASPPACLRWKARSAALKQLLLGLDADFLCLQEVDEYGSTYAPFLAQHGYASIYVKRPGVKRDGSAVFFRADKFELVTSKAIDYDDLARDMAASARAHQEPTTAMAASDSARQPGAGKSESASPADPDLVSHKHDLVLKNHVTGGEMHPPEANGIHSFKGCPPREGQVKVARTPAAAPCPLGFAAETRALAAREDPHAPASDNVTAAVTLHAPAEPTPATTHPSLESLPAKSGLQQLTASLEAATVALRVSKAPADGTGTGEDAQTRRAGEQDEVVRCTRNCVGVLGLFKWRQGTEQRQRTEHREGQPLPLCPGQGPPGEAQSTGMVVVCSTHIFWDPAYADVKQAQARFLRRQVQAFVEGTQQRHGAPGGVPVVVAGDFNSLPDDEAYKLMSSQPDALSADKSQSQPCFESTQNKDKSQSQKHSIPHFSKCLQLQSAYSSAQGSEPEVTTFVKHFRGTIDYLFCNKPESISSLLSVPSYSLLESKGAGIPNDSHPSDHLPIGMVCTFPSAINS